MKSRTSMALLKYLSTVLDLLLPSVHVLFYSVLLGSQLYQSFIVTKVTFAALPRPAFVSLQKRLFPIYFRTQTALIVLTAATFPLGPSALIHSRFDCLPLLAAALPAGLNLAVYGPLTQNAMLERARQGRRRPWESRHKLLISFVRSQQKHRRRPSRGPRHSHPQEALLFCTCYEHPSEPHFLGWDAVVRLAACLPARV